MAFGSPGNKLLRMGEKENRGGTDKNRISKTASERSQRMRDGGITITSYTPEEWREAYGNLIAEHGEKMPQRQVAELLNISRTTLQRYFNNPDYRLQEKEVAQVVQKVVQVNQTKMNNSEEIIDTAFKLHKKGIADAIKEGDWKEARTIALNALKIARVEAEIKRIFLVIGGDVNVNSTTNIQLNLQQEINKIYPILCDKCKKAVREE